MRTWSSLSGWLVAARTESLIDRRLGLDPSIPRLRTRCGLHRTLVSLAREQHAVARLRQLDRAPDGRSAVDHDLIVAARLLRHHARLHIPGNLSRVLAQRIVGRDDEEVRELRRRASHPG